MSELKKKKKGGVRSARNEEQCQTLSGLGPVWYVCLKTENCCLKTFVEIRVGEKIYKNTCNVI